MAGFLSVQKRMRPARLEARARARG